MGAHSVSTANRALEIVLAAEMGFCFGVRRAITMMEEAVAKHGAIDSVGATVHNPVVMQDLAALGVRQVSSAPEATQGTVAITAHGVSPQLKQQLLDRGHHVVDTTCPIVSRAQKAARRLAEAGFTVVIFGLPDHPEVRGLRAYAGERSIATTDWREVVALDPFPRRLGLLSQTTQNLQRYQEFAKALLEAGGFELTELRVVNTLCDATSQQQLAAMELAQETDLILVVGGKQSANTRHLVEICRDEGVTAHHIETATELEAEWFRYGMKVGVTAGASTPDRSIFDVISCLEGLARTLQPSPA